MLGVINLSTFILGSLFIVVLPGPNSFYVLSTSAKYGVKIGYLAALGVLTGDLILILATVFGAASILHAFPIIFIGLKIVGAIYLSYLGINLIKHGVSIWKKRHLPTAPIPDAIPQRHIKPYQTALTISLLNPKAIFFLLSFFIQFVDPNSATPLLSFFVLSIILETMSLVYLTILIFAGSKLANYFTQNIKLASSSTCLVGLLFITFGINLAISSL